MIGEARKTDSVVGMFAVESNSVPGLVLQNAVLQHPVKLVGRVSDVTYRRSTGSFCTRRVSAVAALGRPDVNASRVNVRDVKPTGPFFWWIERDFDHFTFGRVLELQRVCVQSDRAGAV